MHTEILAAVIEIFGIFAIGALAARLHYIREDQITPWSRLIIDFMFPFLTFSSIIKHLDISLLSELWIMMLIGFGLMITGALSGQFLKYGLRNRSHDRMKTFHHFCTINNYGFLPIIIITNLWGEQYLPFLFILNIGSTITFWTIGIAIPGGGKDKKIIRNLISPNLISLALALVLSISGTAVYLPECLINISYSLGKCAVPSMLLIIGASLYNTSHEIANNKYDVAYTYFVRLILLPVISIIILKFLPLPDMFYKIAYIVAIMPVSVSSTIMTRRYGGSPEFAGQAALITTVASLFTIPLFLFFLSG